MCDCENLNHSWRAAALYQAVLKLKLDAKVHQEGIVIPLLTNKDTRVGKTRRCFDLESISRDVGFCFVYNGQILSRPCTYWSTKKLSFVNKTKPTFHEIDFNKLNLAEKSAQSL